MREITLMEYIKENIQIKRLKPKLVRSTVRNAWTDQNDESYSLRDVYFIYDWNENEILTMRRLLTIKFSKFKEIRVDGFSFWNNNDEYQLISHIACHYNGPWFFWKFYVKNEDETICSYDVTTSIDEFMAIVLIDDVETRITYHSNNSPRWDGKQQELTNYLNNLVILGDGSELDKAETVQYPAFGDDERSLNFLVGILGETLEIAEGYEPKKNTVVYYTPMYPFMEGLVFSLGKKAEQLIRCIRLVCRNKYLKENNFIKVSDYFLGRLKELIKYNKNTNYNYFSNVYKNVIYGLRKYTNVSEEKIKEIEILIEKVNQNFKDEDDELFSNGSDLLFVDNSDEVDDDWFK